MNSVSRLLLLFLLAIASGCSDDAVFVEDDLQVYLDRFKEEAALRNIIVDYKKNPIEARFVNFPDEVALGWCAYDFETHHTININLVFWSIVRHEFMQEQLIFHELGHCVLNRPHLDTKREDGFCKSIMHSGQSCGDNYSSETREAYLDELFLRR